MAVQQGQKRDPPSGSSPGSSQVHPRASPTRASPDPSSLTPSLPDPSLPRPRAVLRPEGYPSAPSTWSRSSGRTAPSAVTSGSNLTSPTTSPSPSRHAHAHSPRPHQATSGSRPGGRRAALDRAAAHQGGRRRGGRRDERTPEDKRETFTSLTRTRTRTQTRTRTRTRTQARSRTRWSPTVGDPQVPVLTLRP